MASLALATVGTAIGGPIGGLIGSMIGGMLDNVLFPAPTKTPPSITTSTYGNAIPIAYGPKVRLGANMIWTSGWRKSSDKSAKLAQLKGAPPAYVTDVAFAIGRGPWQPGWVVKIFANGNVLFDSTVALYTPSPDSNGVVTWTSDLGLPQGAQKDFDSLVIYPGNNLQEPDPTIEAERGVGNTPAYRGTAYFVINGLQGTPWGNSVPNLQILASPQPAVTIGQIVYDMLERMGLDATLASTSMLTSECQGFFLDSQTDGVTALQPLALCFNFDVAEVGGGLRFTPRGLSPLCTIENRQLMGHAFGDQRPTFEWPRDPDIQLPKIAALTFIDPARDCQQNTQSALRSTGSSQSNISTTVYVTLTTEEARAVADRMLWEAHIGRQTLSAQTDDRLLFLESAKTYAVEVPFGYETVRITTRTRGANSVIEFAGVRDAPDIYASAAPSANAAAAANGIGLGGPVNPPVFIEPPSGFPGITGPTLLIAISGGDGVSANPSWAGCNVYVATDNETADYLLAGVQIGPSVMGKLDSPLAANGGRPDTTNTLVADTSISGGEPSPQSTLDAENAQMPYLVGDEFLTAVDVSAVGDFVYDLTTLYRGLYGTSGDAHATGAAFVRCDSALFKFALAAPYVGQTLYFRFVSAGEALADVATYSFSPSGKAGTVLTSTLISGDGTTTLAGVLTVTKTQGVDFAPSATTDTTNASNIVSGTLPTAQLPLSGVTPGSYTNANVQVNEQGQVTLISDGSGGSGTVTSVGLSMPAGFTVTGSPITGAGTLAVVLASQNANLVFAGPASGSPAAPTWRALVAADLPATGAVAVLPLVNGDLPGPAAITDSLGQFIGVAL